MYGTRYQILLSKRGPVAENGFLIGKSSQLGLKHGPILLFVAEPRKEFGLTAANPMLWRQEVVPNLGIVSYRDGKSFVMADIPGIIEGAHLGKGLGLRFLRHIERNSILLFMIPCDTKDIKKEYKILINELLQFNPELLDKSAVLAITKTDMLDEGLINEMKKLLPEKITTVFISSITGQGIDELKDIIWRELNKKDSDD